MARDAGDLVQRRVEPNTMGSTLAIQNATMVTQMAFQLREVSCFGDFENLTHGVWRKAFFRKLALALQGQP